ncbi:DUF4368 domain-containing protein [Paenibacillus elgii]|uniref:DUF4368 domain-containing protein n=1 Tax=Paenibacillus elgii TaxID=189691 RepID=UPI001ED977D3|nr:DUF4368 domain-containing protein [Paenibacillus elgii]
MNKLQIARHLNDHGVLCPTAYKRSKGIKYNAPNVQSNPMWSTITIDTILKNRVYVGDMVQQLLKRDTRTAPEKRELYLFSGFLRCADCGRAMSQIANRLNDRIATKEKELAKIVRYKQALYQDWKDGEITRNDYRHMSEDYERQIEAAQTVIGNLKTEQAELEKGVDTENPFLTALSKYENIDKLTREILIELVDHIKVHEGGDISIRFKFADEYRRVMKYIEVNTHEAAI